MRIGLGGALTVTATELWQSELRAGRCFGRGASSGATPGQFSHVQLFNPAGSGKQIILRQAIGSIGTLQLLRLSVDNVARANLIGAGFNLLSGGAAGVGVIRTEDNVAELGTMLGQSQVLASSPLYFAPDWLTELSPGQGVNLHPAGANISVAAFYIWREV